MRAHRGGRPAASAPTVAVAPVAPAARAARSQRHQRGELGEELLADAAHLAELVDAVNRPWAVRQSRMRWASTGPTPGRVSSAARSAVLSETSPPAGPTGATTTRARRHRCHRSPSTRVDRVAGRRHPHLLAVDEHPGQVDPDRSAALVAPPAASTASATREPTRQAQHPGSPHLGRRRARRPPRMPSPAPAAPAAAPVAPTVDDAVPVGACGHPLPARDPDRGRPRAQAGRPGAGPTPGRDDGALPGRPGPGHPQPEHGRRRGPRRRRPRGPPPGPAATAPRRTPPAAAPSPRVRQARAVPPPLPPVSTGVLRPTSPHDRHRRDRHRRHGSHRRARPPRLPPGGTRLLPLDRPPRQVELGRHVGPRARPQAGQRSWREGLGGVTSRHATTLGTPAPNRRLSPAAVDDGGRQPPLWTEPDPTPPSRRQLRAARVSAQPPLPPREDVAPVPRQHEHATARPATPRPPARRTAPAPRAASSPHRAPAHIVTTDASPTNGTTVLVTANTTTAPSPTTGSTASTAPSAHATPLPPRPRRNGLKTWPRTTANPATSAGTVPIVRSTTSVGR